MSGQYVNLFTDFGFKKIFGEDSSKAHLISFLNTLLPQKHQIQDLTFIQNEYQGATLLDRKAIFDLNCVSNSGEHFIVELQKAKQNFFKDRSLFYATFPIQQQAKKGDDWNFKLSAVYTIGILDFVFDEDKQDPKESKQVVHQVQLKNQQNQVFYDKLTFIYLTLPNFTKTEDQLETLQDKWFFLFRHLHRLQEQPQKLQERIFNSLFKQANIAQFKPEERIAYESSLKYYRDLTNVVDTARDEGEKAGIEKGREEGYQKAQAEVDQERQQRLEAEKRMSQAVMKMLLKGLSAEDVAEFFDLSVEEVQAIKQQSQH